MSPQRIGVNTPRA